VDCLDFPTIIPRILFVAAHDRVATKHMESTLTLKVGSDLGDTKYMIRVWQKPQDTFKNSSRTSPSFASRAEAALSSSATAESQNGYTIRSATSRRLGQVPEFASSGIGTPDNRSRSRTPRSLLLAAGPPLRSSRL
jgi:hypothetical protein